MRLFGTILGAVLLLSCLSPRWTAKPEPEAPYFRCDPLKEFPQMLPIPGYPKVWHTVQRCDEYPREKVAIALQTFRRMWEEEFGSAAAVDKVYEDLLITWMDASSGRYNAFGSDGIFYTNISLRGVTLSESTILIFQSEMGSDRHTRICESALIHELVHTVLWAQNGEHGDPDHLGNQFPGWTVRHQLVIQETNKYLCVLGI